MLFSSAFPANILSARSWRTVHKIHLFQAKPVKGKLSSKSKSKARSWFCVILEPSECHCTKSVKSCSSSSSPIIIISHFPLTPSPPPNKFPPLSLPRGVHDNAKGHKKNVIIFAKPQRLVEGECWIPIQHFFSQSRRLLTKIFESARTVNEKFRCL